MTSLLPPHEGYLPLWLLFVSTVSVFNSAQAYLTTQYTRRIYSATPSEVTPLSARTFGTWTFLSGIIRLYAAYHISQPQMYQLALCSYAVAFVHFVAEWRAFGTAAWGAGLASPIFVSTGTLVWMLSQWSSYVV